MRIVWDWPKRETNLAKHHMDFEELTVAFFENARFHPGKHGRSVAVGILNEQVISVVFTPLGTEAISVISMRPASRRERTR